MTVCIIMLVSGFMMHNTLFSNGGYSNTHQGGLGDIFRKAPYQTLFKEPNCKVYQMSWFYAFINPRWDSIQRPSA